MSNFANRTSNCTKKGRFSKERVLVKAIILDFQATDPRLPKFRTLSRIAAEKKATDGLN